MISRNEFEEIIELIQTQEKKDIRFTRALGEILEGNFTFGSHNNYLQALLILLQKIFDDKDDNIGWWLYEREFDECTERIKRPSAETAGELYDFLTSSR